MRSARPGDTLEYYRGDLGYDRTIEGPYTAKVRRELNELAEAVHEEGIWERIMCYQKKFKDHDFSYMASKTAFNLRFEDGGFTVGQIQRTQYNS